MFTDYKCMYGEKKCMNGQCIDNDLFCDGVEHCIDGSDESRDICTGTNLLEHFRKRQYE